MGRKRENTYFDIHYKITVLQAKEVNPYKVKLMHKLSEWVYEILYVCVM